MSEQVIVICGDELASYGFPDGHPFGLDRHDVCITGLDRSDKASQFVRRPPRLATPDEIQYFHTAEYVDFVRAQSQQGYGLLDGGDTPAYPGVYEAAAYVVGGTLGVGSAKSAVRLAGICRPLEWRMAVAMSSCVNTPVLTRLGEGPGSGVLARKPNISATNRPLFDR